jgi:hypothetical protein
VLYTDTNFSTYTRLYLGASSNAGVSFTENLISVPSSNQEHKTSTVQDYHYVPKIAVSDRGVGVADGVSVIWAGLDEDDVLSVFYRRSTDGGATFAGAWNLSRNIIPPDKAIQAGLETVAAQGDYVYAAFCTTSGNVYLRRSNEGGVHFYGLQELSYPDSTFVGGASISGGWWPVLALDPTDATGARVHAFWTRGQYAFSKNGGATFTNPTLVTPFLSYSGSSPTQGPQMAVGPDGRPHFVIAALYYSSSFGGYGDFDIFYRRLSPAPAPAGINNALSLVSNADDARYDNMQVPARNSLNFNVRMTGEVWVRPYAGGKTTGTSSYIKPIFHKVEAGLGSRFSYALQTWDRYGQRQAQAQIATLDGEFWVNPFSATEGLVPDGVWSHLAFTYNVYGGANNFKLYLNGQLIAQTTATGNLATGSGPFITGLFGIWDVAELRLWTRELSQSEIKANMYRTLSGQEEGLNAYYTFKNTTKDFTGKGNDGILMYLEQYLHQDIVKSGGDMGAIELLLLED